MAPREKRPLTYKDAGVDIDAGDALVENIKRLARTTLRPEVLGGIGGFGALVEVSKKYTSPVMVAGTDGVGTKLKLAFRLQKHDTIGIDLVAMSVNDVLVTGAEPVFFLDYFVCERLDVRVATEVIRGIAKGCKIAGCALIGGETAEHPDAFPRDEYDLAGFAVGLVEKDAIIDGSGIAPGDVILGLASSGPHSNGYSLIRKIIDVSGADLAATFADGRTRGEVLLEPTRIYVKPVLELTRTLPVKGIAHITGGGIVENVPRVLPDNCRAAISVSAWPLPRVFHWLREAGGIEQKEMYRTFNCGVGMVLIVTREHADQATQVLREAGETVWRIGKVEPASGEPHVTLVD
ncbi:MAG: phosphoribosylformylglycinamidine cyclo-ligase [Chromatiales bacterium]